MKPTIKKQQVIRIGHPLNMSNILYVFVVIFALYSGWIQGSPLTNGCNKGPTHWCSNLSNAKKCNAVSHCMQTVWSKHTSREDSDAVCTGCYGLMQESQAAHYNEDEIQGALDKYCKSIKVKSVASKCRSYVHEMGHEVHTMLQSGIQHNALCDTLTLCNNKKLDHLLDMEDTVKVIPLVNKEKKVHKTRPLLGSSQCTWGPSYWCANFSNARGCHATKHCISRVWSSQQLQPDSDSVCQICTDMVKQARDQLESNQTQEDLKAVFEGSCKLIPLGIISKECIQLVDEFIPELVETLASEMNPQVVCSVAGLCNNARIDHMLEQLESKKSNSVSASEPTCSGCREVLGLMRSKFENLSYEGFLESLLKVCRTLGSYSDACSMNVFVHFEIIYEHVKQNFHAAPLCDLAGACVARFHQHSPLAPLAPQDTVEIVPAGNTGFLTKQKDLPCELCSQLVQHLRDILIANTTESEFQTVLQGVCNQTGTFKSECSALVDQYYPVIYNYLVSDLKPQELCSLAGLCPGGQDDVPIAPLLPSELHITVIKPTHKLIGTDEAQSYKPHVSVARAEEVQLPLERMMVQLPQNKELCAFCQYFMHYLQVEISDSGNEEQVKSIVEHACEHLPDSVSNQCKEFIEAYGNSIIALVVQNLDPATICPELHLCVSSLTLRDVSVQRASSSSCPLCLFAVEQLETELKTNRTEASIRHALESLCSQLSSKLESECTAFVEAYSDSLVAMLAAEFDAQEVCVYLRLCAADTEARVQTDPLGVTGQYHADDSHDRAAVLQQVQPASMFRGDIETNEIPDNTYNGRPVPAVPATLQDYRLRDQSPGCVICEFVMTQLEKEIVDKRNEDEIKKIVHNICHHMPKSVSKECGDFVDKYADLVIALLAQELKPQEICSSIGLCSARVEALRESVVDCAVCEGAVIAIHKVLLNDKVDRDVLHVTEKACNMLPAHYYQRCETLVSTYGESILHLLDTLGRSGVCRKIGMCGGGEGTFVQMDGHRKR